MLIIAFSQETFPSDLARVHSDKGKGCFCPVYHDNIFIPLVHSVINPTFLP